MVSRETYTNMHPDNKKSLDVLVRELNLSREQYSQMSTFVQLLEEWNNRTNLVSRQDVFRIVSKHVRESIAFSRAGIVLSRGRILDLGSGAGFPGIPLKIVDPSLRLTLIDSRKMKTLFLRQVVERLALVDVDVVCSRVEEYSNLSRSSEFVGVLSRAVAELEKLWCWSENLLKDGGALIAQKGGDVSSEVHQLKRKYPHLSVRLQNCDFLGEGKVFVVVQKELT